MKKRNLALVLCAACIIGAPAFCEDNIFGNIASTPIEAPTTKGGNMTTTVTVEEPVQIRGTSQMTQQENLTTQSLQSTISSIESAQADLKTKLDTAQSNYNAVDQEYQRVKKERAALKKIVSQTKSRISSLEKSKTKVRKAIQGS